MKYIIPLKYALIGLLAFSPATASALFPDSDRAEQMARAQRSIEEQNASACGGGVCAYQWADHLIKEARRRHPVGELAH